MTKTNKLFSIIAIFSLINLPFIATGSRATAQNAKTTTVEAKPSFAEPAMSPDRAEIAFVSGGDIWTVAAQGGEARLLVSHPATEPRPIYSPDGKRLAFVSTRTGNGDIYLLTLDSGDVQRLTFDDANEQLNGWSRDGRWIYLHSGSKDVLGRSDIFRVSSDGGTPMPVTADRYVNEFFAAPAPDGATLAFNARGNSAGQWWRKGHSHLDESEIWLLREGESNGYERVTEGGAKEMWAMWSADGKSLYYVSDRSGAQNIWQRPIKGQARQVTQFKDGRVLFPTISYDGKTIVFERDFGIWKLDTANNQAMEIKIIRRGASPTTASERLTLTTQFGDLALSPDGKKVAFTARGEIFAASAKDGGDAMRVTSSPAVEGTISWSPDSRKIVYLSTRNGYPQIFLYDFTQSRETQLTNSTGADTIPTFSPDGKMIAFERDAKELRVLDLDAKQERVLATGYLDRPPSDSARPLVWSPDSRYVAFMNVGERAFKNIHIAAAQSGAAKPVSFLANVFANGLSWSPDGTYLLFDTGQRTEGNRLARIDLTLRTPKFREDQFTDLFKDTAPKPPAKPAVPPETQAAPAADIAKDEAKRDAKKPVEIVFDGIRNRLSILPVGVDLINQTISPDGKTLLITGVAANQVNLYTWSLDELSREPAVARQLTSTAGFKSSAQFTPDGKEVYYLEGGRINIINLDNRQTRPLAVTAEMDVDFAKEKMQVFHQAWTLLRDNFYDPNYHGVNWNNIRTEYEPQIAGARTGDEMRRLINMMVGELNASHLGISAPFNAAQATPVGRIGLRFDRAEYERNGRLRVTEAIPLTPAAIAGVKAGDYLLAVDGTEITNRTNLDELLANKIARRVALTIASSAEGSNRREVAVKPVSGGAESGALYRDWIAKNRAYVDRIGNGRLGYVHMPDMSSDSLSQLYVDLDAENHSRDGVVIDVRNNNGGFVNSYAIDVFARRGYLTMTPRGYPSSPARSMNGQRSLELPTILLTNQHSLSDAEDFTEGYRALKLGKVVGEPTSGWIIYTWNVGLIDGSGFRIPRMEVTANDGTNMELSPRPVDMPVSRPIGETYTDRDSQLDTAVRELLKQLGAKK